MAVAKPKKIKIYILISRLAENAITYLDDHDDGGVYDDSLQLLPALADQMDADSENDWSREQDAAYAAAEAMSDALDPSAPAPDMEALYGDLESAIAAL